MSTRIIIFVSCLSLVFSLPAFGFGEPPEFLDQSNDRRQVKQEAPVEQAAEATAPALTEAEVDTASENVDADIPAQFTASGNVDYLDLEDAYLGAIRDNKYNEALEILDQFPMSLLGNKRLAQKAKLQVMAEVDQIVADDKTDFFKEDELDQPTQLTLKRLYREAQRAYFNNEMELGKDLLLHSLFLHRRNLKAKKFLEYGWELRPGSYTVEDMEAKYWRQSEIFFYGGQVAQSAQILEALTYINNRNPSVYERLGSSYYKTGETKKAIDAWKTSLFLDPSNKKLKDVIKKAEKVLKEQNKRAADFVKQRQKVAQTAPKKPVKTQTMGTFRTQTEAFSFATEVKKNGFETLVEETESGQWAVKKVLSGD